MGQREEAGKEIRKHMRRQMDPRVREALRYVMVDLYAGPLSRDEREAEGFPRGLTYKNALGMVSDWWGDHGQELWYDSQSGYVSDVEPEEGYEDEDGEWVEPEWDDWYAFDRSAVGAAVFGDAWEYI